MLPIEAGIFIEYIPSMGSDICRSGNMHKAIDIPKMRLRGLDLGESHSKPSREHT